MHPDLLNYFKHLEELPGYEGVSIASVHQRDKFGGTPLHAAIMQGRSDMVLLLIDGGADLNAEGERGETPLQTAHIMGNQGIAGILLSHGAL